MKIKRIIAYGGMVAFLTLFSCNRNFLEPGIADENAAAELEEPAEIISIVAGLPVDDNQGGSGADATAGETKIAYLYADGALKQSWQLGDKLLVYGKTKSQAYVFEAVEVYDNGRARFVGTKPDAANTSFDIVVLGKKNHLSMTHLTDLKNVCFNEMTQTGNNNLDHIESYVWLEGVSTYWDVVFSQTWATTHGDGTFHINPIVHFRIKIPTGSGTPKKIGLVSTAARLIPHYQGGRKVNSLWLNLSGVTPASDIFDAWMPLPEALGAGNYVVSLLMSNNYYYVSPVFTTTKEMAAGKVHLIQKNMTSYSGYGSQAKLTAFPTPMKTDGAFTDWNSIPMLAHPLMETRTLPADPLYKDLYEVRMIGDQGWIFGYLEFKMLGWNYSMPLDLALSCGNVGGYWPLTSTELYDDGLYAFSSTDIDRYLEHNGMTEPASSCFNNWRADNNSSWDNRLAWYKFNGTAGQNVFGHLTRQYYTEEVPHQLTKYYINADGTFDGSDKIGRLEFRLRRFTLNASGTSVGYGVKLIGPGGDDYSLVGWYCRGLLPQGGKDASGIRQVLPLARMTVPTYEDYEYPFVASE